MSTHCKGRCTHPDFRVEKPAIRLYNQSPYSVEGVRYCSVCARYLQTRNMFSSCPCCKSILRRDARQRKGKMARMAWKMKAISPP